MAGLSTLTFCFLLPEVIMEPCLCLDRSGINVIADIVDPDLLPSIQAIAISFPFGIKGYRAYKGVKHKEPIETSA
ncbi:MAG: hypothetical protein WAM28_03460 [Chlamydiales bacterium]